MAYVTALNALYLKSCGLDMVKEGKIGTIGLIPFVSSPWMAWLLMFIFGFSFGFYETTYYAISMSITDGRITAAMFSILIAVANICTVVGLG